MRVKDIMSQPVYTLRPDETIEQVAAMLADKKITAAPVLDETGELVGMVSEGDLLWHRVPPDPTAHVVRVSANVGPRPRTVADVMSKHVFTTHPQADVADVAKTMLFHDVRSLPVIEDARVVGMVSRRDIVRTVIRTDDVLAHEIQHRLDEYGDRAGRWSVTVTDAVATIDGLFDDDTERAIATAMARTVPGVADVRLADRT